MSNVSSVNLNQTNTEKTKRMKNVKGGVSAYMGCATVSGAGVLSSILPINAMCKINKSLSKDEVNLVNNGAQKVLDEITDLGKKGVKITHKADDLCESRNILEKISEYTSLKLGTPKGKNAYFGSLKNEICINKDKLPLATFHEMGHAFNFNNTKFWKSLQMSRIFMTTAATFLALMPAFTRNHKAQEGEELSKKDKFINGLRNASPFLATAVMLPVFAEETMATIRGNNFAKSALSSDLAKKVVKNNKVALVTYALGAVVSGIAAFVTKKIKDKSDEKMDMQFSRNVQDDNKTTIKYQKMQLHQG